MVGTSTNRGNFGPADLYTPDDDACPHNIAYTWKYNDAYFNWRPANKGFSIWCES